MTHFRSDYFTNFSNILYINRFSLAYSLAAIEACLLPIIHCRYMNFLTYNLRISTKRNGIILHLRTFSVLKTLSCIIFKNLVLSKLLNF